MTKALCLAGLLSWAQAAWAAPCTPGTDCYCDKVKDTSSPLHDPNLLMCEDFEPLVLYQNTGYGNGSFPYGPFYDETGYPGCNRGNNSYWNRIYGNGSDSALFQNGQPSSPALGCACSYGMCVGEKVWHPSNLWGANDYDPLMGIMRSGDYDDEIASMSGKPTNASGGASGTFDGQQSVFWRIPAGKGSGLNGEKHWTTVVDHLGITMALAFPTNLNSSGLSYGQWKFNEWFVGANGTDNSGMFLFHQGTNGWETTDPFQNWVYYSPGGSRGGCDAALAGAAIRRGVVFCDGPVSDQGLGYRPDPSQGFYNQPASWPLGTWGCARAEFAGMNTSRMTVRFWFQGPNDANEQLIIDFDINPSNFIWSNGIEGILWDNYANANSGTPGYTPTTAVSGRYEDNVHIRRGAPMSCSQIGFGSTPADNKTPTAPRNLRFR